jgi:2-polyprenyl-3-methyl-5-hydroxy-6-metoxy-1,4-benzoquinol methylase
MTSLRYVLTPDPQRDHSIVLRWLDEGHARRVLDVGAADGIMSRRLTENGWRVTGIENDVALARAGARRCERMITGNLNEEILDVGGPFDAIISGDGCSWNSTAHSRPTASW